MRFVWLAGLSLLVSGCAAFAIPPALSIASYAVDGISYVATGKSVTDHMLSSIVGEDCAMWRLVKLENPCHEWEEGEDSDTLVAVNGSGDPAAAISDETAGHMWETAVDEAAAAETSDGDARQIARWTDPDLDPPASAEPEFDPAPAEELAKYETAAGGAEGPAATAGSGEIQSAVTATGDPSPSAGAETVAHRAAPFAAAVPGRHYMVIASFIHKANGERFAHRHAALAPVVVAAEISGKRFYRVVVPMVGGSAAARRRLNQSGIADAWRIELCPVGTTGSRCLVRTDMPGVGSPRAPAIGAQSSELVAARR